MTVTLTCRYGGAVAWGQHYPPQQGGETATNGTAPGYVAAKERAR